MKLFKTGLLLVTCTIGTVACSKPAAPEDSLPVPAATANPQPAVSISSVGTVSTELADFTVDPGQVFSCDGKDRTTSKVKWSVKDASVVTVKVLVGDKGASERKIFTAGGNVGEEATGNWVVAGTHFSLVDGKTGRVLAAYDVPGLPCN